MKHEFISLMFSIIYSISAWLLFVFAIDACYVFFIPVQN